MRVLLVKLSSLGDVIHNLPVASDLARAQPGVEIDWLIEHPYAEIAAMHPAIKNVWPVPLRHLKKNWWSVAAWSDFLACRSRIVGRQYEHILDTQGLLKSAWVSHWAEGEVAGYSTNAAREPLASRCYDHTFDISRDLHAVERNRQLASRAFGYDVATPPDYGLSGPALAPKWLPDARYIVFLHATSRRNKSWPNSHWVELGRLAHAHGFRVVLPWGSVAEQNTSQHLASQWPDPVLPPAMSLRAAAAMLARADCVVGVDTGLAHLAVALGRPTVGLYVTTQPRLTGLYGDDRAINLGGGNEHQPSIPGVDAVWQTLLPWLNGAPGC